MVHPCCRGSSLRPTVDACEFAAFLYLQQHWPQYYRKYRAHNRLKHGWAARNGAHHVRSLSAPSPYEDDPMPGRVSKRGSE